MISEAIVLDQKLKAIFDVDIFRSGRKEEFFVGYPYHLDFDTAEILVADAHKNKVKGIPRGAFLLAFYNGEDNVEETVLLRAITQTKLPTDNDMISSLVEYYKEGSDISGRSGSSRKSRLDDLTRYEFSFSGLKCHVLGTFYKLQDGTLEFGADLENFYAANNYKIYKASGKVLGRIVNQRDHSRIAGTENEFRLGRVRYSSSRRFQQTDEEVQVFVNPQDFVGKRTAAFGMTRTGKSNTVKKLIEATAEISRKSKHNELSEGTVTDIEDPFIGGVPSSRIGQIIFDVNGEYANANPQDEGSAIYRQYEAEVTRYSVLDKSGFKVMKVNFYSELEIGFELIKQYCKDNSMSGDYVNNFLAVDFTKPEGNDEERSITVRFDRKKAAYLCCLHKAGFSAPPGHRIKFQGNAELNATDKGGCNPSKGISLDEACRWFTWVWENYEKSTYIKDYPDKDGKEWADDDLKALLIFLTRFRSPGKKSSVSGYGKIRTADLHELHTTSADEPFKSEIPKLLRKGKIVIVDLSQGSSIVQSLFSKQICEAVFGNSMERFVKNQTINFIQFYFEEAHNLFPKKEDKDLSQIYNRLAKEGAKLHLGMIYATQEVSSISANILKNTQNWFIAHLNNDDELKELRKYYDFSDYTDSLLKFSAGNDQGFVRMKTYSNPFTVPVQIDMFKVSKPDH